jgi:hypothetical protein
MLGYRNIEAIKVRTEYLGHAGLSRWFALLRTSKILENIEEYRIRETRLMKNPCSSPQGQGAALGHSTGAS